MARATRLPTCSESFVPAVRATSLHQKRHTPVRSRVYHRDATVTAVIVELYSLEMVARWLSACKIGNAETFPTVACPGADGRCRLAAPRHETRY